MDKKIGDRIFTPRELEIEHIILANSSFRGPVSLAPYDNSLPLRQQFRTSVEYLVADNGGVNTLGVYIDLGLRVCTGDIKDEESLKTVVQIDAGFLLTYPLHRDIPDEVIDVFANETALVHIWPFWRQHVKDIEGRAELPVELDVPLMFILRKDEEEQKPQEDQTEPLG